MANTPDNLEAEFLVSQYVDGQLDGGQKADFERRLGQDAALAEDLRRYRALEGHLAQAGSSPLEGVDFPSQRASIMAALERQALLAGRRRLIVFRPAFVGSLAAAAAVVLMLAVGWKFWRPAGPGTFPVPPGGPTVSSVIEPAANLALGAEVVQVTALRMDDSVRPVAPPPASDALPPGTVVVSFSPPPDRPDQPESPYAMFEF